MLSDYKSARTDACNNCFCDFSAFCVTFVLAAGGRATARPYGASGFPLMNGILSADSIKP